MGKYKNRLKDLREDSDITQNEISKIFFLQPTQYRRYENGESDLPLEWAKKFAKHYNVSLDYIANLTDTVKQIEDSAKEKITLSEKQKKLLKAYSEKPKLQEAIDILLDIK